MHFVLVNLITVICVIKSDFGHTILLSSTFTALQKISSQTPEHNYVKIFCLAVGRHTFFQATVYHILSILMS